MNNNRANYDPELMIYEDPPSLRVEDWERHCEQMRAEVDQFPGSQNARLALQSAERMLRELRQDLGTIDEAA